jgi:hypothetical protein
MWYAWSNEWHVELWYTDLKTRKYLEDLGVNGRITLKYISQQQAVDWVHLAQDRK